MKLDQFSAAIAWLECNDGDEIESGACKAAAAFLRKEFRRRDLAGDKRVAKRFGVTVETVTEAIAKFRKQERIETP